MDSQVQQPGNEVVEASRVLSRLGLVTAFGHVSERVHESARLLRSAELAETAAATLGSSDALLLRGNGALACGSTPGFAVARMWLLEAACQTWLAASASGAPRPMEFAEAESWREAADELLPRLWLHLKARDYG